LEGLFSSLGNPLFVEALPVIELLVDALKIDFWDFCGVVNRMGFLVLC